MVHGSAPLVVVLNLLVALVVLSAFCRATRYNPGFPPSLKRQGCLPPEAGQVDLFCPGREGYGCYRIPTLLRTTNGTLLAMIEARRFSCDDRGDVDLRLRRSFDDGKTWEAGSRLVHGKNSTDHWTTVGDANMVQDKSTGIIWLLHTRNNTLLFLSSSNDEGASWSEPRDVTSSLKIPADSGGGGWMGTGHAGGIQLSAGPHKGRLVVPTYVANTSYCVFSDDHGLSWHRGGTAEGPLAGGHENTISETGAFSEDGTPVLIMSMRNSPGLPAGITGRGYRIQALSRDGGLSWGALGEAKQLAEPIKGCEGSIVYHPGVKKVFFSHPDPPLRLLRTRLRIWSSSDSGSSWDHYATVWDGAAAYSSLVVMGDAASGKDADGDIADLGLFYERNNHTMLVFEAQAVTFTRIPVSLDSSM